MLARTRIVRGGSIELRTPVARAGNSALDFGSAFGDGVRPAPGPGTARPRPIARSFGCLAAVLIAVMMSGCRTQFLRGHFALMAHDSPCRAAMSRRVSGEFEAKLHILFDTHVSVWGVSGVKTPETQHRDLPLCGQLAHVLSFWGWDPETQNGFNTLRTLPQRIVA
jgi:hypothetical protein